MGVQACQLLVEDNLEKCEKSKRRARELV